MTASSDAASAWYTANWNKVYFGNDEARGAVHRCWYARGEYTGGSGSTSNYNTGIAGYYWLATAASTNGTNADFRNGQAKYASNTTGNGFPIRLFRETTPLRIGDIYFSDGSYYPAPIAGKTPIGIVVYVNDDSDIGNAATEKNVKATGIGGHGLVLCLKNVSTTRVTWGTKSYSSTSGTNVYTGSGTYTDADIVNPIHYQGYARSQGMNNNTYVAARLACQYTELTAPTTSTGWFLPSAGQWKLIFSGLTPFKDMGQNKGYSTTFNATYTGTYLIGFINTALAKSGASYDAFGGTSWYSTSEVEMYWTSSEYNSSGIGVSPIINKNNGVDLHRNLINDNPGHIFYVRPVLAF